MTTTVNLHDRALTALGNCGVHVPQPGTATRSAVSPITGEPLPGVAHVDSDQVEMAIQAASEAFPVWRDTPAPVRGFLVKRLSQLLTDHRDDIADLITLEVGKIRSEALGEVQEMIDICDFAVGISRQIGGRTLPSERPGHRLMETWHPLGVVAVISAFNFPAAVWAWNTALALVCGDTVIWKPSELAPLTALACGALLDQAISENGAPVALNQVLVTDAQGAAPLVDSPLIALVSATGSERMGAQIAPRVAARFGRVLLELGGNNAAIVTPTADLELTARGIVFSAAGTAGQRCTTLRRLIVHETVVEQLIPRLTSLYRQLPMGDPRLDTTLVGPVINEAAYQAMQAAIAEAVADGGQLLVGGGRVGEGAAYYVEPAIVRMPAQTAVVRRETFAPLLYLMTYRQLEDAIRLHNDVPQGLSSAIFTNDTREAERFMAAAGSDCGIANVNIGTSGAEIGGAFGGEKSTGGGRESGSDAWKSYMRRATNTVNYSDQLPLAQGVTFL